MQNPLNNATITDDELDRLESFIFSDAVSEESLDLIGIHGFLCALVISPTQTDTQAWLEVIFDGEPNWQDAAQKEDITAILLNWKGHILGDMENDRELEMPCEPTLVVDEDDDSDIADIETWAQAFMEGVFLKEKDWYSKGSASEQLLTELMLPIMVVSDLFDAKEFREIRRNADVCEDMANEIPDILVDLYLAFHAPEK